MSAHGETADYNKGRRLHIPNQHMLELTSGGFYITTRTYHLFDSRPPLLLLPHHPPSLLCVFNYVRRAAETSLKMSFQTAVETVQTEEK